MVEELTNYEKIYDNFFSELKKIDLEKKSKTKGLAYIKNGEASVEFFGRKYSINQEKGITVLGGEEISFNHLSAIINYIISDDEIEPSYKLVPLGYDDVNMVGRNNYDQMTYKRPLLKCFGNDYNLLKEVCLKIGGSYEGLDGSGGHVWFFLALPKIPMRLIYHEADDEFDADLQLLFDSVAIKFVEFSCSCSLPSFFVEAMIDEAIKIKK